MSELDRTKRIELEKTDEMIKILFYQTFRESDAIIEYIHRQAESGELGFHLLKLSHVVQSKVEF